MGVHDRPYWQGEESSRGGGFTMGLPRGGRAVKTLLLINVAMFLLQLVLDRDGLLSHYLGVTVAGWWQVWRYISFQFLHGSFWHIFFNMLGLYMLGSPLEQHWGTRRFTWFYLSCGVFAGLLYAAVAYALHLDPTFPLIGASGGVFGIILACAVLFPHFKLIFFLFPVPIRLAAVVIFGMIIFQVLRGLTSGATTAEFWSDVAHLGGTVMAVGWLWLFPRFTGLSFRRPGGGRGSWERKLRRRQQDQEVIDRILKKINDQGLNSLTRKERKTLADATRRQQRDDRELYRL